MFAAEAGDPDVEVSEVVTKREHLAKSAAEVGVALPELGSVSLGLLFDREIGCEILDGAAEEGFQLFLQGGCFGEEQSGIDGKEGEIQLLGFGDVHEHEAGALEGGADGCAFAMVVPGPLEDVPGVSGGEALIERGQIFGVQHVGVFFRGLVETGGSGGLGFRFGEEDSFAPVAEAFVVLAFLGVAFEDGLEGGDDLLFFDAGDERTVESGAAGVAPDVELVAAGAAPDEAEFSHVGPGASVGATGHADDELLFVEAGVLECGLDTGEQFREEAFGFSEGEAAGRECGAGHGGAVQGAGLFGGFDAMFLKDGVDG